MSEELTTQEPLDSEEVEVTTEPQQESPAEEITEDQMFEAAISGNTAFLDDVYTNTVNQPAAAEEPSSEVDSGATVAPAEAPAEETPEAEDLSAPSQEILDKVNRAKAAFERPVETASPAPVQEVAPVAPAVEAPVAEVPTLVVPKRPEVPIDPSDWTLTDAQSMRDYDLARDEFNDKLLQAQTQTAQTSAKNSEVVTSVQSTEAQRIKSLEHERSVEKHWNSIRALQRDVPSLSTGVDIEKLHTEVGSFADQLHAMSGLSFNGDRATYNQQRDALVRKYMDEDSEILSQAKAFGVTAPADFKAYMSISEVSANRQALIKSKMLGENATLSNAYLYSAAESGDLTGAMEDSIVQERVKAGQSIADAVNKAKEHVRIPDQGRTPNAPANPLGIPGMEAANLSVDEQALVKEMQDYPQLINSPVHAAAFNKLKGVIFDA